VPLSLHLIFVKEDKVKALTILFASLMHLLPALLIKTPSVQVLASLLSLLATLYTTYGSPLSRIQNSVQLFLYL
jgi:hypothetical protein